MNLKNKSVLNTNKQGKMPVTAILKVRHKNHNRGITLIAVIITIIIMLILATVTYGAINGGLFEYAGEGKREAEETSIIDSIGKAYLIAKDLSKTNTVSELDLQKQLDNIFPGAGAIVLKNGNTFEILLGENGYIIDENGKITSMGTIEPIQYAGDITKGGVCTGTEDNPYQIECIEDLVKLAELTNKEDSKIASNKYYLLVNDLDFNSIFSYSNYKAKYIYNSEVGCYEPDLTGESGTGIKELCTTGQGFIPIGYTYGNKDFKGIFNGQEHVIKNIYIKTANNAALFGGSNNSTINDLTITGNITCTSENIASGFIASGWGGKINNCCNKATVTNTGTGSASGFLGTGNVAVITKCINEGEITSQNSVAYGISTVMMDIKLCKNNGNVTGKNNSAGIARKRLGRS